MTNWLRYGWPRWYLLHLVDWLPMEWGDRLLDFLYPSTMSVRIDD